MELIANIKPQEKRYNTHGAMPLMSGQEFKIEIDGVEILKTEVPVDEEWEVGIDIDIRVKNVT